MDAFVDARLITLGDVMAAIEADPDLTPNRRRDLISALRRLTRMTGTTLGAIPLRMDEIRKLFDGIEPAAHGISPKTLTNLRSDVLAAILASRIRPVKRPHMRTTLTQPWLDLWAVTPDRHIRIGLSRFFRFCSRNGIVPTQVGDDTVTAFLDDLSQNTLARRIAFLKRRVPVLWNRGCDSVGGWPEHRLTVPDKLSRAKLTPLSSLPPDFVASLDVYARWLACDDRFAANAREKPLRPASIATILQAIKLATHTAILAGHALDTLVDVNVLTRPDVLTDILRQLNKEADNQPSMRAHQVADAIIGIGQYLGQSPDKIESLKAIRKKLKPKLRGLTAKNRELLRQFEDPALYALIAAIPERLWKKGTSGRVSPKKALVLTQNAILFELLMHAPLRLKTLRALSFDLHISFPRGSGKPALLHIEPPDMKNERPYEAELVQPLASWLTVYREQIVPAALGTKRQAVFVSVEGERKTEATIRYHFNKIIRAALGLKMSPHQIRHVMAKFLLDRHPGAHELVRELLGHHSLRTTRDFYAPVDTRRAVRFHDKLIEDLRNGSGPAKPKGKR
jgi:integrase